MPANGYGAGNLPMDLYKMVYHNNWDYNGRADGQGDYTQWGIRKVQLYYKVDADRTIINPEGLCRKIFGDDMYVTWVNDDTMVCSDNGFYWSVDGDMYMDPNYLMREHDAWDWSYQD